MSADPRTRLPIARTSFVGREEELAELAAALGRSAMVTVTGTGGAGKTRLAIEAARRVADRFESVLWVDLSSIAQPAQVAPAVATAAGAGGMPGADPVDEIALGFGDRPWLLVLDNCEHLLEASAGVSAALLERCPGLTILVTSRIPLRLAGEKVMALGQLPVDREAVRLFVERAGAVNRSFSLGPTNEEAVRRICRRLDGLPLAIELAAPWTAVMSLSELLPLLDQRFELLTGGPRGAAKRQRTLRGAIDWSHELLSPPERVLFRRLTVFSGGFVRAAAEAVCSGDGLPRESVLGHLASLCTASMAVAEPGPEGPARYRLLESLRAYGAELLEAAGETARLRERHFRYFAGYAERAFEERMYRGGPWVSGLLEADRDNVRSALDWGAEHDPDAALGLAASLVEDIRRSLFGFGELRSRLQTLLATPAPPSARHAWALIALGYTAMAARSDEEAIEHMEASWRMFAALGNEQGEAWARLGLGHMLWTVGDTAGALRELRHSEQVHERLGNRLGTHRARLRAAMAQAADPRSQAEARTALRQAVEEGLRLSDRFGAGLALSWEGFIDVSNGAGKSVVPRFLEALDLLIDDSLYVLPMYGIAACCAAGNPERALKLIGAGDALQPRAGMPKPEILARVVAPFQAQAARQLGEAAARRAYEEGFRMSREQAIALTRQDEQRDGVLTRREQQVAALVAEGLTNRQVAERLVISVRTVETHVDRILTKLGFPNRSRLAAWMASKDEKVK